MKLSLDWPASKEYRFPPIVVQFPKTRVVIMNFTSPVARDDVSTAIFIVYKPYRGIASILCEAQVVMQTDSGSHYFLEQPNIPPDRFTKHSPLCCKSSKCIFNASPGSGQSIIENPLAFSQVTAGIWLH